MHDESLLRAVQQAWIHVFERESIDTPHEKVLYEYLLSRSEHFESIHTQASVTDEIIQSRIEHTIRETIRYLDGSIGYIEAAVIVSRVEDTAIALQAFPNRSFLDPLNWDLRVHQHVIATCRAVLLLFGLSIPPHISDEEVWSTHWSIWIVKNIEAHSSGWEWIATNEPTGLFTQPYLLHGQFLTQVQHLLHSIPVDHTNRCWSRMEAYACLRDWVEAAVGYVHLKRYYLPGFEGYDDICKLMTPPVRTPAANIWFRVVSNHGVEYFYNRLNQQVVLETPVDFDGYNVTTTPLAVQELIKECLSRDHATRLELERREHKHIHDKLIAEDEWIECINSRTNERYYYSFKHFRVSENPPSSGVAIPSNESIAFQAVLKLQSAYRRRRLKKNLQVKHAKRASLPTFSSLTGGKKFY